MLVVNFLKGLFDNEGRVSSKRFVGIGCFVIIFIAAMADVFLKKTISEFVYYGIVGILCACFGLNTFITSQGLKVKKDIAGDVLTTGAGDSQDVKEIIQANKP